VGCVDRDGDAAAATAAACEALGARAVGLLADVADEAQVTAAVDEAAHRLCELRGLFANAAMMGYGRVLDTSREDFERMLAVNVIGVHLCARAVLPHMIATGGGAIVATSSDCAVRTCSNSAAYVTSKTAVLGLVRSIAIDYGTDGIRANAVIPGVSDTPGLRETYREGFDESIARAAALSPLGRIGQPLDVATAVAFLLSDDARFITGTSLLVDGGMTATYGAD
jgi:NAD(P)-dependent dehydrogenase (short-subunit alcohol dehydrogenase family)